MGWNNFALVRINDGALTNDTPLEIVDRCIFAMSFMNSSEFGFDYLRDNSMAFSASEQVQRGYYYAIIDEVDSILIDEARTL